MNNLNPTYIQKIRKTNVVKKLGRGGQKYNQKIRREKKHVREKTKRTWVKIGKRRPKI